MAELAKTSIYIALGDTGGGGSETIFAASFPAMAVGVYCYRTDLLELYLCDGVAWIQV